MHIFVVRPQHFFASTYILRGKDGGELARFGMPLFLRMLKSNRGFIKIDEKEYMLVDSMVNYSGASSLGASNTSFDTYVKDGDKRIAGVSYATPAANDLYEVKNDQDNQVVRLKIVGWGKFKIEGEDGSEIGTLDTSSFFLRRSIIRTKVDLSPLTLSLIYWGAVNTKNWF